MYKDKAGSKQVSGLFEVIATVCSCKTSTPFAVGLIAR